MALNENNGGVFARRPWLLWTIGIVAAVLLLAAFMSRGQVVLVQAATVRRSTIRSVISTNGKVEPLDNFQAHAPIGTTVKRLLVKEGGEKFVKENEWNEYIVEADGPKVKIWINGNLVCDYEDDKLAKRGRIAFQVHSGGPTDVRYKDIKLEVLSK